MAKKKKVPTRHRLLVYYRLGQRWRTAPLFTALVGLVLYALGWLAEQSIIQSGDTFILTQLYQGRVFIIALIAFSLLLYILTIVFSRISFVEARSKVLRVQAGFVPLNISYGRIKQTRLTQLAAQYPLDNLRGASYALLEPFAGYSCSAVDMASYPMDRKLLERLWNRFMFNKEGTGLLFVVDDAITLNQQIDHYRQKRAERVAGRAQRYTDPIERVAGKKKTRGSPR